MNVNLVGDVVRCEEYKVLRNNNFGTYKNNPR